MLFFPPNFYKNFHVLLEGTLTTKHIQSWCGILCDHRMVDYPVHLTDIMEGGKMSKHSASLFLIFLIPSLFIVSTYQAYAQQNPNVDPTIVSFYIGVFHDKYDYRIDSWAEVDDPQGGSDIQTVKVIDANGGEFDLQYQGNGIFNGSSSFGLTSPPLGETQIVATDKSGNSCTVHYSLTNVIEQLPIINYPGDGDLISDTEPLFDWADVSDEQSGIVYSICVYRHDNGEPIWRLDNISESQARFNFDGTADESLQEVLSYDLEVSAFDTFGNSSYDFITFSIGSYKYLENDLLKIRFHPIRPHADQYTFKSNNGTIYGDIADEMFYARLFYQDEFYDVEPSLVDISQTSNQIRYHIQIDIESDLAATFDLSYLLDENTVEVTFGNVTEEAGYRLIYVQSPDLITIRGTQPGAKLVFPYAEGRLIDIATSDPGGADLEANGWLMPLLMGMLYYDGLAGIVSYDHLDMVPLERIYDNPLEGRLCSIGMKFNYRYAPTNLSSAAFIDVFDSETSELSLRLTFTDDYDGDQDIDWIDGAKVLRDQVKSVPDQRYLTSFITKIGVRGIDHISDHLTTIRKLYNLTDHNRIYSYLLDCGLPGPEIFGVEEDLRQDFATLDDLEEVFQIAKNSYNTFLSFHDNYIDYFAGSPTYDPDLRVTLSDGTVEEYQGDAHNTFIADPYDYAIYEGLDRVRRTVERYPIKETYHIDVLGLVVPKDYSPDSPSNRERNRRGIQLIIDEFAKSGINVTTESIIGCFVESGLGWFLDTPRILTNNHPFSDPEIIPLIEFIYHGKTLYGLYPDIYPAEVSPELVEVYTYLEPLLLGANSASHLTYMEPNDLELEKFYLIDLPWMALNQRFMQDYEEEGSYRKVTYDEDTFVEIDYEDDTYTVQVDGRVIAQNYKTVYHKDENTFLVFSRDQQLLSEPLPDGWDENISLQQLTEDGYEDNIPFEYSDRTIIFDAEANTPYKIIKVQATDDRGDDNRNNTGDNTADDIGDAGGGGGGGGCFIRNLF